jgi:acyl-CoA synthetase (AMP-forming)/AMP-acid ligase II
MATRLLEHGDLSGYDLSTLTTMSLGSAPASSALFERLREAVPGVARALGTTYGQTETSTAVTLASAADVAARPDTVGRVVVNMDLEIRDPDGNRVPDGVEGEIHVHGPQVMTGYIGDPEATAAAVGPDGWLRTGDLGTLENGYLRIASRRSDLIIRAGENVYPAEVEHVLVEHAAVLECAVIGVVHADLGEEVAAVVVLTGEGAASVEELSAFTRVRLAHYKVPSRWTLTTERLPRNATGKVKRYEVQPDEGEAS